MKELKDTTKEYKLVNRCPIYIASIVISKNKSIKNELELSLNNIIDDNEKKSNSTWGVI